MGYDVRTLPLERLAQAEVLRAVSRRPVIHGLFEADVSVPRALIRDGAVREGARLSFTAFLVGCLARAVDEEREVQAFRRGRRLVVFDEVDVATLVEVDIEGRRLPTFHVVRDAAGKGVGEIHSEIRHAASAREGAHRVRRQIRRSRWVPRPIRSLLWRALARAPGTWKRFGGTVVLTSVGMFGAGPGWGVPVLGGYPLGLTVGGMGERPAVVDGRLVGREHLSLTVSFDHEVLDGAPAARFAARLKELIEGAHGLATLRSGERPSTRRAAPPPPGAGRSGPSASPRPAPGAP